MAWALEKAPPVKADQALAFWLAQDSPLPSVHHECVTKMSAFFHTDRFATSKGTRPPA